MLAKQWWLLLLLLHDVASGGAYRNVLMINLRKHYHNPA
jgi:hypothetical protein